MRDGGSCLLASRQGNPLNARIGDDGLDVTTFDKQVDVCALRQPGVSEYLFLGEGGFGAVARVLEDDGVTDEQVRAGESCDLIVGIVPRHDSEEDAERL